MTGVHEFTAKTVDGQDLALAQFRGQVLLVVNTASRCGFTPQYEGLEALQREYGARGFSVLGFPCNQFANQEPGEDSAIQSFCQTRYDVTFPVFAKVEVNGAGAHPLFRHLKDEKPGLLGSAAVKWNFTKFLVDRAGVVRARYAPAIKPARLRSAIEGLLATA